ncbi:hypothetical protein WLH_05828 (plasmid) [Escherichia coli O25b:H4]|uniref:Uncharacterized protein n=1 Tax=Escherichia coli O25b:H4 TaxID=941280 RepID=A0A192CNM6_ECO25|nr:hypothetical protein WLH_05828 [Escherichia coli O25b:H4]
MLQRRSLPAGLQAGITTGIQGTPGLFPTSSFSALFQIFPEFHHEF